MGHHNPAQHRPSGFRDFLAKRTPKLAVMFHRRPAVAERELAEARGLLPEEAFGENQGPDGGVGALMAVSAGYLSSCVRVVFFSGSLCGRWIGVCCIFF